MQKYELMFIVDASLPEDGKKAQVEKVKSFLTSNKAENLSVDVWGNKKYAYKINHKTEGYYVVVTFESAPEVPNKLEQQLNINESIVRHMFVKLEKQLTNAGTTALFTSQRKIDKRGCYE